jgi:hypothetical protein
VVFKFCRYRNESVKSSGVYANNDRKRSGCSWLYVSLAAFVSATGTSKPHFLSLSLRTYVVLNEVSRLTPRILF